LRFGRPLWIEARRGKSAKLVLKASTRISAVENWTKY